MSSISKEYIFIQGKKTKNIEQQKDKKYRKKHLHL